MPSQITSFVDWFALFYSFVIGVPFVGWLLWTVLCCLLVLALFVTFFIVFPALSDVIAYPEYYFTTDNFLKILLISLSAYILRLLWLTFSK